MDTPTPSTLLTVEGASSRLGVSVRTVRRWARRADVALTARYPLPGRLRFDAAEVEALRTVMQTEGERVA